MGIKQLSIDIETFSDVDLKSCGVYKYAESPSFEILLFGYSVNGGPVQVIDLALGETIPEEILDALTDNTVIKTAFNASFERVCLSYWLRKYHPEHFKGYGNEDDPCHLYLDPAGWRCSLVLAAYNGLPLSLEGVGAVLKLEQQKMSEGKRLIKFFSVPCTSTMSNGFRTRNMPYDDLEKWNTFKVYNKRDVEVETAISQRLAKYEPPQFIWDQYHLDQQINDRGILVDMDFVRSAIALNERSSEELSVRMQQLTSLENPNSVMQLKTWLADNGVVTEKLGKKDVVALLKDCPGEIAEVLRIRQQLSRASIKKYQAMQNCACKDNRARGCFFFYGANRSGRWCLTPDHEVLTPEGWMRFDSWQGGPIACWNASSEAISFQDAQALQFDYDGPIFTYKDSRIDQSSTPDHKMRVQRRYGEGWADMTVEEMSHCRPCIPINGYRYHRGCANPIWIRVLVMTQADGYYRSDGSIRYHFKKQRKIERCKHLLRQAQIMFTIHENSSEVSIDIPARAVPLWLRQFRTKTFGFWLFDENPDIFFDELPNWDGYKPAPNSIQYSTTNKQNADIVQALAHMSGRTASVRTKQQSNEAWHTAYVVDIWLDPGICHEIKSKPVIKEYDGKVYCASTPTGYFLVRRNGKCWVTGNSGRLIQLQNLPQNHIEDLDGARDLVKAQDYAGLKVKFNDLPDVLSQLIRTAFVAPNNFKFIVADYCQIEARVLSFLSKEEWRLKVFETGGDIYSEAAANMFHVKVEKNGVNGHLRQKGKQAELACIAKGQLVLTNHGLIPIEEVTLNDRLWDGEDWVEHDGVVYRGKKQVITYEGLTATNDHKVFIQGQQEPVDFNFAASGSAHLVQTEYGGRAIRLGEDYKLGKTVESELQPLLCDDTMSELQKHSVAGLSESQEQKVKRLSGLLSAQNCTILAIEKNDRSQAKMYKSKCHRLRELWRQRNQVCISKCKRIVPIPDSDSWIAREGNGNRPNRHQWGLCSRKSEICYSQNKLCESKKKCPELLGPKILALCKKRSNKKTFARNEQGTDYRGCSKSRIIENKKLARNSGSADVYDILNAGRNHRFTVSGKLVHNCGYGGSIGALRAMGAIESGLKEEELQPLVTSWRAANPNIVSFWWAVDAAAGKAINMHLDQEVNGIRFCWRHGMLFVELPSGRHLSYVKPRIEINDLGRECITYEGTTDTSKHWGRVESYGPKFVENVVQGMSRDILAEAMMRLSGCRIVGHVHDEVIIEAPEDGSVEEICAIMGKSPTWLDGIFLKADGYETFFYKKS